MSQSIIDLLREPRILARLTVTTTAAATRALADGQRIVVCRDDRFYWQYADGRRLPIVPDQDETRKKDI